MQTLCFIGAVQETYGGTGDGDPCAFPFVYNGVNVYECISSNHDRPWCGTTTDYDTDVLWGNCDSKYWTLIALSKTADVSRTLVGNEIVDHSDVVGASPVGAAPTKSSFSA